MILKKIAFILLVCCSTTLISLGYFSNFFTKPEKQKVLQFNLSDDYKKDWKRVDSLISKGLTQSAIDLVSKIYDKSKKENNSPQLIKSILYKMRLESYKEEFSLEKSIFKLSEEVKSSKFPVKPVIQSILADSYWQYYQNNRWKFQQRSATVNFKNDDVSTWSLNHLVSETIKNYVASLSNTDSLKQTKVDLYDEVITMGSSETRTFRPTLYDFLAHRAIDFFKNTEADVNRPAAQFHLNHEKYFFPSNQFAKITIEKTEDSLNLKYFAINLFQDLINFHQADDKPDALINVDLERISFIYAQSKLDNKDTLYLQALNHLVQKYETYESSAEALYKIAEWYSKNASLYNPLLSDDYKWYNKIAYDKAKNIISKFPKSFGARQCDPLIASIETKTLNITSEEFNEPNKPFRSLVKYRNLGKVYFRIIKTSRDKYKDLTRDFYGEKLMKKLAGLSYIKAFEYDLPNDNDLNTHSAEIKIPELDYGYYIILAATSPEFTCEKQIMAYSTIYSSNLAYMSRKKEDGTYDFFIVDRVKGNALPNVKAQIWKEKWSYTSRQYIREKGPQFVSDKDGFFNVSLNNNNDDRYYYVELETEKDNYYIENSFYNYSYDNKDYEKTKTFFFLDRAIYRPGQTVYFKALRLSNYEKENTIQANTGMTVTFYDVNYQQVAQLLLTTNEYGTVNGSFTIPMGILNGSMSITDGYGTAYFSVEDYKRPKFEVSFEPLKGSYKVNDSIQVFGRAKAYGGFNIDGAEVRYRVVRTVSYPYWWYWYRRGSSRSNADVEITNGVTITNDTGGYVIPFKALPDPSSSKKDAATFNYTVYADVTDINGETHSSQTSVRIGYNALTLNLSMDELLNADSFTEAKINSSNLNGVDEPSKGKISVYKLKQPEKVFRERLWEQADKKIISKEEYYKLFPFDMYEDELNKYKWEKQSKINELEFDNKIKKELDLKALFKNAGEGMYFVEAVCKDKFGEEVKDIKYVTLYNNSTTTAPEMTTDWFMAVKSKGEPGEKASFIQSSALNDVSYLFEVEHSEMITKHEFKTCSMKPVELPIEEKHRGNFVYHINFVKYNRYYHHTEIVNVPYTNKELDITFETFRNKLLPGQEEEWKMIIKNKKGEKEIAELLCSMYDASLDAFASNNWYFDIYERYYSRSSWNSPIGAIENSYEYSLNANRYSYAPYRYYDRLNYFGLHFSSYRNYYYDDYDGYNAPMAGAMKEQELEEVTVTKNGKDKNYAKKKSAFKEEEKSGSYDEVSAIAEGSKRTETGTTTSGDTKISGEDNLSEVKTRSNFNETAFFFPQLQSNEKGEVIVKFTVPESLTKWKVLGFAHTKDLKFGLTSNELVTQKDLMVQPNAPRFFRENDKMYFTAKVTNLSDKELKGDAEIKFYDALNGNEISSKMIAAVNGKFPSIGFREFNTSKGKSDLLEWELMIPEGTQAIQYKVVVKAGNFSDGEEMVIPVLTNRMLVTESMPLPIRSKQTKEFNFEKFVNQNNGSTTLRNHQYTLEFTANPAWYAIQSLPYLMEYPYECAEQTFSRYYANSLASHIVNSKPKIKQVFDAWKLKNPDAFMSNLQKNQELKSLLLEETPWVMEAKDESERKNRVALLFDLNKMSYELGKAMNKLQKTQASNGGWPWFEGGPDDYYITQHIVTGMGHLDKLGVENVRKDSKMWNMLNKAVLYCDDRMREDFEDIKKWDKDYEKNDHLGYMQIQYLYARSYFIDIKRNSRNDKAFNYFFKQAQKYWLQKGRYMQGMIALGLNRFGDLKTPKDILKSLKENAIVSEEMGMYWKENYDGFYWYQAPIESQSLLIEAFDEVNNDQKAVDDLKTWLLKSKQTQNWQTTKATCEAVYALLLRGTDWLATEPNVEITLGNMKIDPKNDPSFQYEAGTGYFKKNWTGSEIKPEMGKVKVAKKDEGVSWGALYWQYFEQLDKITPHETPLKLNKKLFVTRMTSSGPVIEPVTEKTKLKPGDKIKVRIELRVDRDMQYVHMKDMRGSCFEPTNVFSSYKWQDGLGYYESTKDAATNFFFPYLGKGTYVFEYPMVTTHYGNFSNGITTIQCMYAPEFTSHSEGIRVSIVKQ